MGGLGSRLADVVEEHFLDRSFVASVEWRGLAARLSGLDGVSPDRFHDDAQQLLDALPLSHVQLLSPDQRAQAEAQRSGDTPVPLRMGWRRGAGWFYLRLPSFTIPAFTLDTFLRAVRQVDDAETLVVDLRLNAGGSLSCAGEVLGALFGADIPYAQTDLADPPAEGGRREVRPFPEVANQDHGADVAAVRSGPTVWRTPARPACSLGNRLVVVTGARTYSAGEIVAAALKEHARGTLVGARTAGAVVAADEYPIEDGWVVTLPFAHLRTGLGNQVEHLGVDPDVPASFGSADTAPMTDDEIDAAVLVARADR